MLSKIFDKLQDMINKKYEEDGLTDEVLEAQVSLNSLRCKTDTPDESEFIYRDFVQ